MENRKSFFVPVLAVVLALAVVVALLCTYSVDEKQQAVVTTFGKVTNVTGPGLHFNIPFVQSVKTVDTQVYQNFTLGYNTSTNEAIPSEASMITGDYNIVNVDFYVEYKITDPVKYLYATNEPVSILRNLIQSQIRNVVGSSSIDDVLTTGKENIQRQIKMLVTEILAEYDIGLSLVDIKIQDAEPPTNEVIEAFKAVETAKQAAETTINDANAYKNTKLPEAQAQADKLIQNAESAKQARINEATQQVAMFTAMYEEFSRNPELTRSRMYYEAIQEILPGVKVYIDTTGSGNIDMMLPLETFSTTVNTTNNG